MKGSSTEERKIVAAVLNRASEIVEEGWTKGENAKDINGHDVEWYDISAVLWSATAAIHKAEIELDTINGISIRYMNQWIGENYSLFSSIPAPISIWHDSDAATKEKIVMDLREAAIKAADEC